MTETKPGNFIAFVNRDKAPGDNRPAFEGRLSLPGTDAERRLVLWAHELPEAPAGANRVMFMGQADALTADASPIDQIAALTRPPTDAATEATYANLTLRPQQIVLFPNKFKDEDPSKPRPDYWGAFNPGNGQDVVRLSVWAKKDRNGNPMLAGATSYPLPGKSEASMQADAPTDLLASVEATVGKSPRSKASRG